MRWRAARRRGERLVGGGESGEGEAACGEAGALRERARLRERERSSEGFAERYKTAGARADRSG